MSYAIRKYPKRRSSSVLNLAYILALTILKSSHSWQLPKLFGRTKKPPVVVEVPPASPPSPKSKTKAELISVISNTGNGKDADLDTQRRALTLVKYLEDNAPTPTNLLEDPVASKALEGVWYLQYTAPSDIDIEDELKWTPTNEVEGNPNIDTPRANVQGSVRAGNLVVDTSRRVTTQTINVEQLTIENKVDQDFGTITVGGSFRPSKTIKTRAVVSFETANITLNDGFVLQFGFLFSLIAAFRGGNKENGWLETTFLDEDLRIGRGDKGSLFVLTREKDAVAP